jgi:beta-lactam-binding protein with PASTA domain/predicted Ser/Thr protein kinase
MEPVNESPQSPRVLGNRYEVGDLLGRGGMAEVHLGRDTRLGRVVAIKLLRIDLARDPMFQARFRREAQSAAGLNHPAIVAVYDTGEETIVESGGSGIALPYIVMEHVEGRTLRDALREERLDVHHALEVTAGVLSALDYSHRMGIVHRDIKPANVMLTVHGDVKVMDFGIARALADVSATMTQTQAVIGTAQYLSPEQARGETVDARSDLYSAGCLLYELLTGRPPFVADSPVAVAYQHVRELPQPPSTYNPAIPENVDHIVLHALAKEREARYQTAAEFRVDVEATLAGRSIATTASTVALAGSQQMTGSGTATEYLAQPAPGSTRALPPIGQTMPQAPVGAGGGASGVRSGAGVRGGGNDLTGGGGPPAGPDAAQEGLYARRGDRRTQGADNRRGGFAVLALAIVVIFAAAAYGVSHLVGQNSAANTPIPVPTLTGLTQTQAVARLEKGKLSALITQEASNLKEGIVVRTDPPAGKLVKTGSEVTVVVSSGTAHVTIPDVSGKSKDAAKQVLSQAGLTVTEITNQVPGNGINKGLVVDTDPAAGQTVPRKTEVTLQISSGKVTIPDVVGKTKDEAVTALNAAGVDNGSILIVLVPSEQPENQVIGQDPTAGPQPSIKQVKLLVAIPTAQQPSDGSQDNGSQNTDTGQGDPGQGDTGQGDNGQGNDRKIWPGRNPNLR